MTLIHTLKGPLKIIQLKILFLELIDYCNLVQICQFLRTSDLPEGG